MADTKLGTAQIPIRATLDELDKDLSGVRKHVEGALAGVQDLGKLALGGLAAGALAVGGAIATIGPIAINAASDLNESFSKATVVFGDSIKIIDAFAATSASSFGISKQAAYEATGTFGNLFTTMKLSKPAAADMSVGIVKLAADLASFNNLGSDEVLQKLRSGLVGESEPLRTLGINLTEAAVEAKAMTMGLGKVTVSAPAVAKAEVAVYNATKAMYVAELKYSTGSQEWRGKQLALVDAQNKLNAAKKGGMGPITDSMKLQARYALIMEQSKTASGDFARTSDGLANTQRILDATFKDISADVGTAFLPAVLGVVQAVQPLAQALMPKLQEILKQVAPVAKLVGDSFNVFVGSLLMGMDPLDAFRALLYKLLPTEIYASLMNIVVGVREFLATIQPTIDQVAAWLAQNVNLQDVLIALGVAIAAVVIPAIWSVVAAAAPIVAAFIGLVAVAALLRSAWENDWGGIRTALTAFWEGTAKPALEQLWAWLAVNVPAAIQTLSDFWNNTLMPALNVVWTFIQTNVLPMLATLWNWLAVNVTAAIQTLANFWNNTLMPALNAVWAFIQTNIVPLLSALANVYMAGVNLIITAMAGLWQNVLLPALNAVWVFIQTSILPTLTTLWTFISATLGPVLTWLGNQILPAINTAFGCISAAIGVVIGWLNTLASSINSLKLPSWLQPGSATPLETGMLGIGDATSSVAGILSGLFAAAMRVVNYLLSEADRVSKELMGDMTWLASFATGAMAKFQPLVDALFSIRGAAAEAGGAVGGVASGLEDIKANSTIDIHITTYFQDIYLPDVVIGGGGGGGGGTAGGGGTTGGGGGEGGGTCFLAGTPVALPCGGSIAIEDVRIGDVVVSYDTEKQELVHAHVKRTLVHPASEVSGWLVVNGTLCVTPEHTIWVNDQWSEARTLRVGDRLLDVNGDDVLVYSVNSVRGSVRVYNLHIEHAAHNYFAGGVLVHNSEAKQFGGPVMAGGVYTVGEAGPELFVPNLSGQIIPNAQRFMDQLNAAMGSVIQATAASAAELVGRGAMSDERGARSVVIYGGLTLNGVQDAPSLLAQLQAMA